MLVGLDPIVNVAAVVVVVTPTAIAELAFAVQLGGFVRYAFANVITHGPVSGVVITPR